MSLVTVTLVTLSLSLWLRLCGCWRFYVYIPPPPLPLPPALCIRTKHVCVCPVWVPCVALSPGGGSTVGPSPLCGSPVWVPCMGPLCRSSLCGSPVWVPCVGPMRGSLGPRDASCGIYSRDISRSFTRFRSKHTLSSTPTTTADNDFNSDKHTAASR